MSDAEKLKKNVVRQSAESFDNPLLGNTLRILDASINRASEGLRVVEAWARMALDDAFLSRQLKQLRHDLTESCAAIEAAWRLRSRDSEADVGRNVQTEAEYQRDDFESLLRSNMSRVQQAARTIEEFSKSDFPDVAKAVEQVRYRAYTLEKAVFGTAFNRERFQKSHLYVLVDACEERTGFAKLKSLVTSLVDAGVDLIQLRDKSLSDSELIAAGKVIGSVTHGTEAAWVMNDRVDLCVAAGADGVHLGQEDLSVHEARMMLRSNQFIGVSTHSAEQARKAVIDGADYIGVGPVFPSPTKDFDSHVGVKVVKEVLNEVSLPAFAIGGISDSNIATLIAVGCRRVAVSSAICKSEDPSESVRTLRARLGTPTW